MLCTGFAVSSVVETRSRSVGQPRKRLRQPLYRVRDDCQRRCTVLSVDYVASPPCVVLVGIERSKCSSDSWRRIYVPPPKWQTVSSQLSSLENVQEAAVLSTDDVVELYAIATDNRFLAIKRMFEAFCKGRHVSVQDVRRASFIVFDQDAARRLVRKTVGINAPVLCGPKCMQVVLAARDMCSAGAASSASLYSLFQFALNAAEKVKAEIGIADTGVTVPEVAVMVAANELNHHRGVQLSNSKVTVVGAGKHVRTLVEELVRRGIHNLCVVDRSDNGLQELCVLFPHSNLSLYPSDLLYDIVSTSDVVFLAADDGNGPLLKAGTLSKTLFGNKQILVFDLLSPSGMEPAVSELEGVTAFRLGGLQDRADWNKEEREAKRKDAEVLVEDLLRERTDPWTDVPIESVFNSLRTKGVIIYAEEMTRAGRALSQLSEEEVSLVEIMAQTIVNRLLDGPLSHVSQMENTEEKSIVLRNLLKMFAWKDRNRAKCS